MKKYMIEWRKQVDFLIDYPEFLEDWEIGLLDSCDKRLSENRELSFNQSKYLRIAYNRTCENIG